MAALLQGFRQETFPALPGIEQELNLRSSACKLCTLVIELQQQTLPLHLPIFFSVSVFHRYWACSVFTMGEYFSMVVPLKPYAPFWLHKNHHSPMNFTNRRNCVATWTHKSCSCWSSLSGCCMQTDDVFCVLLMLSWVCMLWELCAHSCLLCIQCTRSIALANGVHMTLATICSYPVISCELLCFDPFLPKPASVQIEKTHTTWLPFKLAMYTQPSSAINWSPN